MLFGKTVRKQFYLQTAKVFLPYYTRAQTNYSPSAENNQKVPAVTLESPAAALCSKNNVQICNLNTAKELKEPRHLFQHALTLGRVIS